MQFFGRYIIYYASPFIAILCGFTLFLIYLACTAQEPFDTIKHLALTGDIQSARTLATCYEDGCTNIPQANIIACAWRNIISKNDLHEEHDMFLLHNICSKLNKEETEIAKRVFVNIQSNISKNRKYQN